VPKVETLEGSRRAFVGVVERKMASRRWDDYEQKESPERAGAFKVGQMKDV
jgi:hypothetical protein